MEFVAIFNNMASATEYEEFKKRFSDSASDEDSDITILESNACDVPFEISNSELVYIFNKEMDAKVFDECIKTNDERLVYTNYQDNYLLATALAEGCSIIIAEGISTDSKLDRPDYTSWVTELANILNKGDLIKSNQRLLRYRTPIDTFATMNITVGQPLQTDYVFVINYRNQADKIKRALDSVLSQNKDFSFGIAITDDHSGDDSIDIVKETLSDSDIPYVINENTERKYSARNLWNSIKYMVANPDSVIIELDGDDFLNPDFDVLSLIDPHYKNGILKTSGGFKCYPEPWDEMEGNQNRFDISKPWQHAECSVWIPLRTYKRSLFQDIDVEYFLERDTKEWLTAADDASIGSRMIELADGHIMQMTEPMYIYDNSGSDHDVEDVWNPWYAHTKLYHGILF
jgi:hypothetical protein